MNSPIWKFLPLIMIVGVLACSKSPQKPLPYIGFHEVVQGDTVHYKIPAFTLLNQEGMAVNNDSLGKHIYVSDFFYTYCPSICPKVKKQMLRIYDQYEKEGRLKLVSFALDPKRDNVENLNFYSKNLGVDSKKWYFLTGNKEKIWDLAAKYLISVQEDPDEPGGITHSGKIILIDTDGHIRGFAEGTDPEEVTAFMEDIDRLLEEVESGH